MTPFNRPQRAAQARARLLPLAAQREAALAACAEHLQTTGYCDAGTAQELALLAQRRIREHVRLNREVAR